MNTIIRFLLVLVISKIVGVLTAEVQQPNATQEKGQETITSEFLIKNIDDTVDPCKDFYNFACGKYVKSNVIIPDGKFQISYWQDVEDYILRQMRILLEQESQKNETHTTKVTKNLYKSCLNSNLHPLMELFTELGGWPVVEGPAWDTTGFSMTEALLKYHKLNMLSNYWFTISFEQAESQGLVIIEIKRPSWSLRYFIEEISSYVNNDVSIRARSAVLLGADPSLALKEMSEMVRFQTELGSNDVKFIIFAKQHYFRKLALLLKKYSIRTLSNYMLWNFVWEFAEYISDDFRQLFFDSMIDDQKLGRITMQPRWEYCVQFISKKYG